MKADFFRVLVNVSWTVDGKVVTVNSTSNSSGCADYGCRGYDDYPGCDGCRYDGCRYDGCRDGCRDGCPGYCDVGYGFVYDLKEEWEKQLQTMKQTEYIEHWIP